MGKVAIFAGNFAKTLKQNLNLFDQAYILTGSIDPSAVATDGPPGSLFLRSNGSVYIKQDSGTTTNWTLNDTSANSFVQGGNSFGATALFGTNDAQRLDIETAGTVRATFDTSGNLGVGISSSILAPVHVLKDSAMLLQGATGTPAVTSLTAAGTCRPMLSVVNRNANAWQAGLHVYTGGTNSGVFLSAPAITLGSMSVGGAPANASSLYTPTHTIASSFEQNSGAFVWRADTGLTVGTNATLTERMRLTASGLLGIGTASPSVLVDILSTTGSAQFRSWTNADSGNASFILRRSRAGATYPQNNDTIGSISFQSAGGEAVGTISLLASENHAAGSALGTLMQFQTVLNGTTSNATRMAISGLGNVGVGASTSPASLLQVNGNISRAAWTTVGVNFSTAASTLTDTTGTGTIATKYANSFGTATLASTNVVTQTSASNLAVFYPQAGANTTITTGVALDIAASSLTATNAIGIRINAASTATNIYGICTVSATAFNGFGTTAPTALIHASGNQTLTTMPSGTTGACKFLITNGTVIDSQTAASGTLSAFNFSHFQGGVLQATNASVTCSTATNVLINGMPQASTNISITNNHSLRIASAAAGAATTNAYGLSVAAPSGATNNYCAQFTGGNVSFNHSSPSAIIHIAGNVTTVTPSANAGAYKFLCVGAVQTSSDASGTVSAMSTANFFGGSFASSNAGTTVTNAATVLFGSYTGAGTNVSITNSHGIRMLSTAVSGVTNSYGLSIAASTGATNNYCAQFTGGNVGFRVTAPTAYVHISAGTATAGTAPLKIDNGTLLTTPEAGAIENDGTSLYYTNSGGTRAALLTTTTAPTQQRFTSGSGTYTTPANVRYIRVVAVGGGGGGGGSGVSGGTGGTGGNTTFGSSLLTANGGAGVYFTTGSGGTATISSPAFGTAITGASGTGTGQSSVAGAIIPGGMGGVSPLGGAGAGGIGSGATGTAGGAAVANTGSGGGGAGANNVGTGTAGSGGCAGGYLVAFIASPSASYSYAVGAAGSGGAAGTTGSAGGAGGSGYIEVTEFY